MFVRTTAQGELMAGSARSDPRLVACIYRETRERIAALVAELDGAVHNPVPACPKWSVHDMVAHLAAVAEDWGRGVLNLPPSDEDTAAQIARFHGYDKAEILRAWADASALLARMAETEGKEPPLGDITSHEHDLRGALGSRAARDTAAVWLSSDRLLTSLQTPVPLRVIVEDAHYRSGPHNGAELRLRTTRFEALRWRTGRRSRAQLAAMEWSDDPTPVLEHLYMFGPADADLIE
jgi:hypothetical protein